MRFDYFKIESLPPLAWLAKIKKESSEIQVFHGQAVSCHKSFMVAGVWEKDFISGEIDTSFCLQGSGIKINKTEMGGGNCLLLN